MQLSTWIINNTGLTPEQLFGPNGAIGLQATSTGGVKITRWNIPNVTQPSDADIANILAQPEPATKSIVRSICMSFIYSYADTNTQMNATALIASGKATPDQLAAYQEALVWIKSCRDHCNTLLANNDTNYAAQKETYPAPSQAVIDFINGI